MGAAESLIVEGSAVTQLYTSITLGLSSLTLILGAYLCIQQNNQVLDLQPLSTPVRTRIRVHFSVLVLVLNL